jgi:putative ABC transport system permease protein
MTFAIGVGSVVSVYSVIDRILYQPLPFSESSGIKALLTSNRVTGRRTPLISGADYKDLVNSAVFDHLAYYDGGETGIFLAGQSIFCQVSKVSSDFFSVFSVGPILGRSLTKSSFKHEAMLNKDFAIKHYGSLDNALTKFLSIDKNNYQIVGILPENFLFPSKTSVWIAAPETPENLNRDSFNYNVLGFTKYGLTRHAVDARLKILSSQIEKRYPDSHKSISLVAVPLIDFIVGDVNVSLYMWFGAAILILAIACTNVSYLQLVRFAERKKEVALYVALGAQRIDIIAYVLVESLMIGLIGAIIGLLLSLPILAILLKIAQNSLPRHVDIMPDWKIAFVAGFVGLIAAVISSIVPSWKTTLVDAGTILSSSGRDSTSNKQESFWRKVVIIVETCLTFVLLTSSCSVIRTIMVMENVKMGFSTTNLPVVFAHLPTNSDTDTVKMMAKVSNVLNDLRGVKRCAQVNYLPMLSFTPNGAYALPGKGQSIRQGNLPYAYFVLSSTGYFSTLGIPLISSRDFLPTDDAGSVPVAIISSSLESRVFGRGNAIDQFIICGYDTNSLRPMRIVGVIGDIRQKSPAYAPKDSLYMPLLQHPDGSKDIQVIAAPYGTILGVSDQINRAILTVDNSIAVRSTDLSQLLDDTLKPIKARGKLMSSLSALGLLLSAIGIFGVISRNVVLQRTEIGIRMALGSSRRKILVLVLKNALFPTAIGISIGLLLSVFIFKICGVNIDIFSFGDQLLFALSVMTIIGVTLVSATVPVLVAVKTKISRLIGN